MSAGLRDRQLTICNPAAPSQQVVAGLSRRRYEATTPVWGRIDPPTGRELTMAVGAEHRIDGICLLHQDVSVSRSGVILDDEGIFWEIRAVQLRRSTMEQQIYLERSENQRQYMLLEAEAS